MSVPMRHDNEPVSGRLRPNTDSGEVRPEKVLDERGLPSGVLTNHENLGQNLEVNIRQRRTVEVVKTIQLLKRQ